jgi:CRISPR-associated protein Cmr1
VNVELSLETVTPMFLGGANQQPELRPASFRGALRHWYRALVGGAVGSDLNALRVAESKVFGDTEGSSPVRLRLRDTMNREFTFDLDKDSRGRQLRNGHNYLFYSTRLGDNRRVPFSPRQSRSQGIVTLTFSTRPGAYQGDRALQHSCASAWLLTHFGGLGTRSRRCGGSLQALEGSWPGLPDFPVTARNAAELQKIFQISLRQICALVGTAKTPSLDFDVIHPDVCRVWVIRGEFPWLTWKDAVEAIGTTMQTFRAAQGENRNELNSIFGLPIRHDPSPSLQRRASPLWLRVTKLASGEHVGVATLFKANFTAERREVGGGYTLIERFIQTFPVHLEVIYR